MALARLTAGCPTPLPATWNPVMLQGRIGIDVESLAHPDVMFVGYRVDGELLAVGALRRLGDGHAELKSMHTAAAARGRGIGRAVVDHLVGLARDHGVARVSLETGTMSAFEPARALYARAGFTACEAFGAYEPGPNSTFMTLALDPAPYGSTP